jgi:hypothetical protein
MTAKAMIFGTRNCLFVISGWRSRLSNASSGAKNETRRPCRRTLLSRAQSESTSPEIQKNLTRSLRLLRFGRRVRANGQQALWVVVGASR